MRKRLVVLFLLLVTLAGQGMAQSRTITGTVTSVEDGSPIIGATVIIKGTNLGTVTNVDGTYSLNVPDGKDILIFKFIGMSDKEVKISGSTVNVTLQADVKTLTETVITANAIKREKRSLGYSAPTVKSDELTRGQAPSALNGLSGKVAGVNITGTANAPGSSSRIVLRGGSSIAGNNQALIVVDGVPIDNSSQIGGSSLASTDFGNRANDINPDDIESMTILKGPAAAALYGSRASNGAVIITTKSGKKGAGNKKNEITFNSAVTFSNVLKLPELQNEYGQGGGGQLDLRENWSWGAKFNGEMQGWGQEINGVRQEKPYVAQPDNIKNFFELGRSANNNLSISGAGEKSTYYLSLNALNSDGVMPGDYDKYNKYSVRFNGTTELSNKFTSSINVSYTKINSNMVAGGQGASSVYNNVLQTPRDIPLDKMGNLNNPYYGYDLDKGTYGYYGAYTVSPYFILKNYQNNNYVDRVAGNFALHYKANSWLEVTNRLGADVYSDRRNYIAPKFSVKPVDQSGVDYNQNNIRSNVGSYSEVEYNLSEITNDLMITGKKQLTQDLSLSVMLGNNIRQRAYHSLSAATNSSGLVIPGYYNLANSNGNQTTSNYDEKRRLVGVYGAINLGYKDMLYLDMTARNDWSSTLPKKNNSFFYPSVSGSWVFTELLKDKGISNILNYGKLRANFAQVGNDADPYSLTNYYSKASINGGFGSTIFPFNGVPGFTVYDEVGNPNLEPEITTAYEIGTELNFFNNNLTVDFSYYHNISKNQIIPVPLAYSSGYVQATLNAGKIENKGVELSLRGTPIRTSYGLNVEFYGTFTKNVSNVISVKTGQLVVGGFNGMSIVAAEGQPYGSFYAVDIARDDKGRVIVDEDGYPEWTDSPRYLGSYNPDYQASLGTNIHYKGWNFNMLFETKQGGVFFSRTKDIMAFVGTSAETVRGGRDPHIWPNSVYLDGDGKYVENTDRKFNPEVYYPSNMPPGTSIVDASYVRLREASLSYRLPKNLLNRTPFGDITLGLFGNNLFLWTAKSNEFADPEINSTGAGNAQGFDFTAQPSLRNFGFNVKVSF
ncbi:SusC/RagA family TonB-linked outer membrane protein [Chitinophaga caeni]|uniref:SusC/RagA family TonB-linked outer membrane protein n=1 Tax=Chitinophaga caeni TaxID=2029983 RepID=A0A291R0R9_9BACT|nr:SusC/RagA family TonB-linked outer membrane protein [Chitinophaga caeni]ATL49751.1 SusC/RagA family TonB-linked outer membrane protein [Chitinophaga caeni]